MNTRHLSRITAASIALLALSGCATTAADITETSDLH